MWGRTRFTELVGCRLPIQQAGMGGVATPALAGAVAAAGGLGMLGGVGLTVDQVVEQVRVARAGGRVGVNFLVPFLDLGAFDAAAEHAGFVECFYGDPVAALVGRAHERGALIAWQVGSVAEALAAVEAGCDVVVAQGVEAGGHVRGTVPLLELLDAVRPVVDVPLVAAGGIGSARAVAAAVARGADAVRVGTLLLATPEADVHPAYAAALAAAGAGDTVLTEAFSEGWPGAPHRVLRSCVEASDADPSTRSPMPPTRDFDGDVASAALYAGTSVGDVRAVEPAAAVVERLVAEAAELLAPTLRPIGRVESPLVDPAGAPRQPDEGAPEAWLRLDPAVAGGLRGLSVGDEVVVLSWLDRADRSTLTVHPRGDESRPPTGVFATRSQDRPNPIGLHHTTVLEIAGSAVRVRIEAVDGTPVLDVKPALGPVAER